MRDRSMLHRVFAIGLCLNLMLASPVRASTAAPRTLFLDEKPQEQILTDNFKEILAKNNLVLLERKKIQFLLARISQSKNTFIRNGEEHTSREAASHLRWKYSFAVNEIKTADEFIVYIASKSLKTGAPYLMKTRDGSTCALKDILVNELDYLNHTLKAAQKTPTL